jgi:primosomal protein N'
MYIVSVIPLTKIPLPSPQTLDYFSAAKISGGGIVEIKIGRRSHFGIAASCQPVRQKKQDIKRYPFKLRPIEKVVNAKAIIPRHHMELVLWTSAYFYSPLGLTMKALLPKSFSKPTQKFLAELSGLPIAKSPLQPKRIKPTLYWGSHNNASKIDYYTKKIRAALKYKRTVLFLVPELYKIPYFREKIPLLKNERCAIGTRSILSTPRQNLGLIILDEEESPFYKSFDQQPYINAKTIALKLAELTGAEIILGTDLPSIESLWRLENGQYNQIGVKRETDKLNPQVIDMRRELKTGNYSIFSRELQARLTHVIENKQQAILFINRKGLNTGLVCRDCGHTIKCPNCDVPMVYHKANYELRIMNYELICHHCGQKQNPPTICPKCESYRIKFIGTGTQRVAEELMKLNIAPREKIARLDLDTAPTFKFQEVIFRDFYDGKYNILICTQLGLKAELLPAVDLAAIITADPMFSLPDFRIKEYFYRIADKLWTIAKSNLLLQTYITDNPILKNVPDNYLLSEINAREELSLPPFSQIINLSFAHKDPQRAEQDAMVLKNKLTTQALNCQLPVTSYQLLGPAPAFIPRVNNRYIWQIMIKSKIADIKLRNALLRVVPSDWKIDVDPIAML